MFLKRRAIAIWQWINSAAEMAAAAATAWWVLLAGLWAGGEWLAGKNGLPVPQVWDDTARLRIFGGALLVGLVNAFHGVRMRRDVLQGAEDQRDVAIGERNAARAERDALQARPAIYIDTVINYSTGGTPTVQALPYLEPDDEEDADGGRGE